MLKRHILEGSLVEREADCRLVSRFLSNKKRDPIKLLEAKLGAPFLSYRKRWEAALQKAAKFPIHVDYELMGKCNLKCPICPMSMEAPLGKVIGEMSSTLSVSKVKELIDEGCKMGQGAMGFGGLWEPLLSPHLEELISYGRQKGLVDIMFNTNGNLLTAQRAKTLIDSGLTRIMVSLDAYTQKTYKLMRPGGDLERVEENILKFLDLKGKKVLPLVRLSFCLTSLNEHELYPFLKRWEEKVDFFSVQYYGNFSSKDKGIFPKEPLGPPPPLGFCDQPFRRVLVRHNGTVLPCCDLSSMDQIVGNVHEESLFSIWQGSKINKIRDSFTPKVDFELLSPSCRHCQEKYSTYDL
ncbi:MAG: radical SAM protein [Deltaproteobacteria bacterium]|nr:radical SAM protein [Deltaproteobacteria bacterium]